MELFSYENIQKLNTLEIQVYNYVIKNGDKVSNMKIRELAENVHVSTTVVLNFCKKLNCTGFTEFKLRYKGMVENSNNKGNYPTIGYHKNISNEKIEKQIGIVSQMIADADTVIFIGTWTSGVLARYAALYLQNIGKPTKYIDRPYYPTPSEDHSNNLVFIFSVSGETSSTIHELNTYKGMGAKIVAVTNTEINTVAKLSDIVLSYYVPPSNISITDKITQSQYDIKLTSQIPVLYYIEELAKRYYEISTRPTN